MCTSVWKLGYTYLAVDEFDVLRALGVAVTSSVLGTGLVVGERGLATILSHLDEVESTVDTAGKVGHVDIEREFLVQKLEHLVVLVIRREVDTGANVGAGDEFEGEGIAAGGDTVGAGVFSAVEGAVLSTGVGVGADARIPLVTGVAVGVAGGGVEPTPVGVEHDGGVQGLAAASSGALHRREVGVGLGCLRAGLLAVRNSEVGESGEGECAEHVELLRNDQYISMCKAPHTYLVPGRNRWEN